MIIKPGTEWESVYSRCRSVAPEAFGGERLRNFWGGRWRSEGTPTETTSPIDGTVITGPPRLETVDAKRAVRASLNEHRTWSFAPLAERKRRVVAALGDLAEHRELLALLLVWEIGKTWKSAQSDVDRCVDGVRWYASNIEGILEGRAPLPGPVSNIASWNYPMSVLMHAMLVQALAGNAAIAKAPTDGGVNCLTLAVALVARQGVPVTLVSGGGAELSEALVRSDLIGCLSFVGGRSSGGEIAASLVDSGKRHILEQEGLNCWGVWEFSDWPALARHVRGSFEYGKQRCTAYPRYVVQRSLFDDFLAAYLPAVRELKVGHPLAVARAEDPLPQLDFGPLINDVKVKELCDTVDDAISRGGVPLHRGSLGEGRFLPGQDTAAYLAPVSILNPPPSSPLHHAEPFGPVDSVVLVDTEAEMLAAMNASNGSLVASLACDDEPTARRLAADLQAFKVGINRPRSRGDREEHFGGRGASWRGAFVGGELLVQAVTEAPDRPLYGHFPTHTLYPPT
ncbi:aldehyde dehydrogenase family protein [Amycolatopsis alkalitolerans]|uniref:Aldehyde dehydrogenase n=1 Tax=Amycolatopsis alkalitolerans TaxID=2547244 RepID=A0A5C4M7M0_9PSEU|nr:aldehyde dehydrogenase family protein [Amycolatopsis alkalitolerans]TNC28923.1 aldehyde dehydrogenase [Amycolatopsis alkalitolerans]